MLKTISWQEYLTAIAVASAVYYLFVLARYYDLKKILKGRQGNSRYLLGYEDTGDTGPVAIAKNGGSSNLGNEELDEIEQLAERMKRNIAENAASDKSVLLQALESVFSDFPALKRSALRDSINELAISECEKNGVYGISEEEVDKCWQG